MSKGKQICEWTKNLLIVALLCSAAWLLVDSQMFGRLPWRLEPRQSGTGQQAPAPTTGQVTLPMAVAVLNDSGVCAARYDAAAVDELFQPLLPVLGEALAGAGQPQQEEADAWLAALSGHSGAWFELQGNVPMQVLCRWLAGTDNPYLTGNARQILLCVRDEQVFLCYRCDEQYQSCAVEGMSAEYLRGVLAQKATNGADFAHGRSEYETLAPQTLILPQEPSPEEYVAINPLAEGQDMNSLLQGLAFAPGITTVYQTPEGYRARSGNDTLTVSDAGRIGYEREGDEQRYPLAGNEEDPAVYRAVETARQIVCGATQTWGGTAVYLRDVRQEADGWHVEFGYVLNATAVQLDEPGWCAEVVLDHEGVVRYQMILRGYQPAGKTTLLLPQPQAAAVLEQMGQTGSGLLLNYLDGGDSARAAWIADR
ncbi:MAG: hypothetical protein IJB75_00665 [Oscillospiraceae bacterium]|nr:hypothetical protein [Oscillospiraceae bacterium]